ncbi:MAG: hypothetical protein P8X95_08985 [Anaerolineales bacterium]|jgi:hypothetical protein
MSALRMKIANLDEASVQKVRDLEEQMESVILVLEPHRPLADLTPEQVERLHSLEKELGVLLLAYQQT